MTEKDHIVKSIKFDRDMEKKIRVLAAEEGISFGEWVRRACYNSFVYQETKKEEPK
jgi:hypothetical protein